MGVRRNLATKKAARAQGRAAGQFYWPRLDKLFHAVIFDTILRSELNVFCIAYLF